MKILGANIIVRKAKTVRRLAAADRKLAFQALALLATVRIALRLLPFQRVVRLIDISGELRPMHGGATPRQVAWAVRLASRYMPAATCLPQALSTHVMLSRNGHPSCLHVGVASAPKFEAHAWVECEGTVVIGGRESMDRFASILTLNTRHSSNT